MATQDAAAALPLSRTTIASVLNAAAIGTEESLLDIYSFAFLFIFLTGKSLSVREDLWHV